MWKVPRSVFRLQGFLSSFKPVEISWCTLFMAKLLLKVSHEGITSFRGSTCNMSWDVDRPKYCSLLPVTIVLATWQVQNVNVLTTQEGYLSRVLKTHAELICPYAKFLYVRYIQGQKQIKICIYSPVFSYQRFLLMAMAHKCIGAEPWLTSAKKRATESLCQSVELSICLLDIYWFVFDNAEI